MAHSLFAIEFYFYTFDLTLTSLQKIIVCSRLSRILKLRLLYWFLTIMLYLDLEALILLKSSVNLLRQTNMNTLATITHLLLSYLFLTSAISKLINYESFKYHLFSYNIFKKRSLNILISLLISIEILVAVMYLLDFTGINNYVAFVLLVIFMLPLEDNVQ